MKTDKPIKTERWQVNRNTWIELPKDTPAKIRKEKINRLLKHIKNPPY